MQMSIATCTIVGLSSLSQSRQHQDPKLEGESPYDYDERTWLSKLNVSYSTKTVIIPAHGMHQAIIAASKYSGEKIPGQGNKTWTAKFTTGIAIVSEIDTGLRPEDADSIVISANSDGVRGSGKRVPRKFPIFHEWSATFDVYILDPIITETQFRKVLETAGMFIGVGRFRPEKGGGNGRWLVKDIDWKDNRKMAV